MNRKEKRELEKDYNYFFEFLKIKNHFFENFDNLLLEVNDPRHQSYTTYDTDVLLLTTILKNVFNLDSMRSMTESFNRDECIENIRKILHKENLDELPHYDTINDFLSALNPEELEKIRLYMIKELLKKRSLERYRINGKYWGIIIDGSGLFSFDEKHCEHCLRREYKNEETGEKKTVYMHHVLEAKLVVGDMVLSIASEFIENESEDTPKQDCELKAFNRLEKKLKQAFKRLPICILADSLYPCQTVFDICDQNQWKYLFRFKEGRITSIAEEFNSLKQLESEGIKMSTEHYQSDILWVNDIAYRQRKLHLIECELSFTDSETKKFTFLTNIRVSKRNANAIVQAGRSRWKIENEGFNKQKNILYNIEHVNSKNYTAMKNHYILTQITDILMQLYEKGSRLLKSIVKTLKIISSDLLEKFQHKPITAEDIKHMVKPIQVRFT